MRATREMVPENVDAAITRALAKLPADRFATASQFSEALQDSRYSLPIQVTSSAPATFPGTTAASSPRTRAMPFVPWALAAAALVVAGWSLTKSAPEAELPPPAQFIVTLPDSMVFRGLAADIAVSRDGTRIALVVNHQGRRRLALRSLAGTELRLLDGTEGATRPFFSPEGESLGFVVDNRIRSVSLAGGEARTLLTSSINGMATWSESGIVFVGSQGLMRLPPDGGTPVTLTTRDSVANELHVQPSAAPGGRVLFVHGSQGLPKLSVAESDGSIRSLDQVGLMPTYVETGHVLYNSVEGNLMALPVDSRLRPVGAPLLLLDGIRTAANAVGLWSASRNGTLIAQRSFSVGNTIVAVDRTGRAVPLSAESKRFRLPRASPDGKRIAIQGSATGINSDAEIWMLDRRSGALSRFTTGGGNSDPVWSHNGERLAWAERPARGDTNTLNRNVR